MTSRRTGPAIVVALALAGLALAGCSSAPEAAAPSASAPGAGASGSAPATTPPAASPAPSAPAEVPAASASADPVQQWCEAYAAISGYLASAGTTPEAAPDTLKALDSFNQLWTYAGEVQFLTPDEVAANTRAVAAYAAIIQLVAGGAGQDSPEVTAASTELTTITDADRPLLEATASKVVGLCGAPSGAPTAPTESATPVGPAAPSPAP